MTLGLEVNFPSLRPSSLRVKLCELASPSPSRFAWGETRGFDASFSFPAPLPGLLIAVSASVDKIISHFGAARNLVQKVKVPVGRVLGGEEGHAALRAQGKAGGIPGPMSIAPPPGPVGG